MGQVRGSRLGTSGEAFETKPAFDDDSTVLTFSAIGESAVVRSIVVSFLLTEGVLLMASVTESRLLISPAVT